MSAKKLYHNNTSNLEKKYLHIVIMAIRITNDDDDSDDSTNSLSKEILEKNFVRKNKSIK